MSDEQIATTPQRPYTLAIDVGGTGIKAALLDATGKIVADRVRVDTHYPLTPELFVSTLATLTQPLPKSDRASVGFPGVVRHGHIITAPHFITKAGPDTKVLKELVDAWSGFDAEESLEKALGVPTKVANDADLQGLAVIKGTGIELVVTFGTGVGTALFRDGELAPHLELAHHPLAKDENYNQRLGEAALARIGVKRWRTRVLSALDTLECLVNFDRCFVGGGNARHLTGRVPSSYEVVDNVAGILGGIRLWEGMAVPSE
ncbi:MAG TPA: ROK family protein [Acidimicrobiales bacterium]